MPGVLPFFFILSLILINRFCFDCRCSDAPRRPWTRHCAPTWLCYLRCGWLRQICFRSAALCGSRRRHSGDSAPCSPAFSAPSPAQQRPPPRRRRGYPPVNIRFQSRFQACVSGPTRRQRSMTAGPPALCWTATRT